MPYASVDDLAEYMGLAGFGNREARAESMLEMAGNEVKGIAPVPADPALLSDYQGRAANAEKMVAEFLLTTGGFRKSESKGLGALSSGASFADMDAVRRAVIGAMGQYATANKPKKPAAVVSRMVRRG